MAIFSDQSQAQLLPGKQVMVQQWEVIEVEIDGRTRGAPCWFLGSGSGNWCQMRWRYRWISHWNGPPGVPEGKPNLAGTWNVIAGISGLIINLLRIP
ncbi:MAG: hypothetical protein CM1200mP22_29560 [Dehalococcoidia bacterium]|nr:MAG: hypothetical protein CM1200mP22_29560 [Dehalococcoidia bacterium]